MVQFKLSNFTLFCFGYLSQKSKVGEVRTKPVHFIIKRNLRRESAAAWLEKAMREGACVYSGQQKRIWLGKTKAGVNGQDLPHPIFFEVTERQMKKGQRLLFPEISVDTYFCSLDRMEPSDDIELQAGQFISTSLVISSLFGYYH